MNRYYCSSTSSSESDTTLCEKLNMGLKRKKKFPPPTLKRNKREGMCMLSGDEKSSQEMNIIRIDSDIDFNEIPIKEFSPKSPRNLVEFEEDNEFEESLMSVDEEISVGKSKEKYYFKHFIFLYFIFNLFVLKSL